MINLNSNNLIDGYAQIHNIDVENLKEWWKVLLLVLSNLFAIFPIIYAYIMGYYLWGTCVFIAMIVSMAYHLCQTTNFCMFGMPLSTWQELDHVTAGSILALSILILILYRPINNKKYIKNNMNNKLGPDPYLSYENNLRRRDKSKICFDCRGVNPIMIYDWQSECFVLIYIYVIFLTINALPLTTQSFVIIVVFGLLCALFKIVILEEGDPSYLKNRFHLPSLITGIVLIVISLIFYFIDGYMLYWLFHSFWHDFSFIGFLFYIIGISKDLNGWFNFVDILRFLWRKIKFFLEICRCCKFKKKGKYDLPYTIKEDDYHIKDRPFIVVNKKFHI